MGGTGPSTSVGDVADKYSSNAIVLSEHDSEVDRAGTLMPSPVASGFLDSVIDKISVER